MPAIMTIGHRVPQPTEADAVNIPQRADKWIAFALTSTLAVVDGLHSTGGIGMAEWGVAALMLGALFTLGYVLWCVVCRRLARALRVAPESGTTRAFINGGFLVIMLLMFVPITNRKVTITLPKSIDLHVHDHGR